MDELTLTCWIRSEDPEAYFRVKISKTDTVLDLQEAIKNKKLATFSNVDADTLALYKPKTAVSKPYKEHLSKLILSEHGDFLQRGDELSDFFPEPPPKRDIHVIVDAPSRIFCWSRGGTLDSKFEVKILQTETVSDLKVAIKNKMPMAFCDVDADTLRLFRISGDDDKQGESINTTGGGELLQGSRLLPNFLDVPVLDPLRVVIDIVKIQSPTL
ncbi:hypothetical protein EV363DRAFT_43336 [Boletus edulis]|nr:hypothetical protein EV363DRAFT_479466 [Boletus edulis]KAF8142084.1 hypothetical protein EV363DRAFT_43336 [Boletus edulis]